MDVVWMAASNLTRREDSATCMRSVCDVMGVWNAREGIVQVVDGGQAIPHVRLKSVRIRLGGAPSVFAGSMPLDSVSTVTHALCGQGLDLRRERVLGF